MDGEKYICNAPQLRSRQTSSSIPRCLLGPQNISAAPPDPVFCLQWSGLVWSVWSLPDWVRGQWCLLPHALPATSWDHSHSQPGEYFLTWKSFSVFRCEFCSKAWQSWPEEHPRTWMAGQSQGKEAESLLQGRNQIVLGHMTEKWLKIIWSCFRFYDMNKCQQYICVQETHLCWHHPGFALNRPWSDPSLKIILNRIYSNYHSRIIPVCITLHQLNHCQIESNQS